MYDAIVIPTLLYASEIWALRYLEKIGKTQVQLIKNILRLPRNTPIYLLRTECGRNHTAVEVLRRTLNWWLKLLQMKNQRVPRIYYNRLLG